MTSFADSAIKNPNVFLCNLTCADGFSIRPLETRNKNKVFFPANICANIWCFILSLPMDSLSCRITRTQFPFTAKHGRKCKFGIFSSLITAKYAEENGGHDTTAERCTQLSKG